MLRRSGYGDLSQYGGAEYDFTTPPAAGTPILKEHGEKTNNVALQVADIDKVGYVTEIGEPISGMNTELEQFVTTLESESMEGSTSSCKCMLWIMFWYLYQWMLWMLWMQRLFWRL